MDRTAQWRWTTLLTALAAVAGAEPLTVCARADPLLATCPAPACQAARLGPGELPADSAAGFCPYGQACARAARDETARLREELAGEMALTTVLSMGWWQPPTSPPTSP